MPSFTDDIAAVRTLRTRLEVQFASGDYGASYASGVDVIMTFDESDEPEHAGRPMLLIWQESGELSSWSSMDGDWRDVAVIAEIRADDFSGTQVGTANPVAVDELLSRDLQKEICGNRAAWSDMGLLNTRIRPQRMVVDEGDEQTAPIRKTQHRIEFKYNRN